MPKENTPNSLKENFLVIVDESPEFLAALKYACKNAKKNKMGIILLYVIELENFRHWKGVETIMRKEQDDKAKEIIAEYIDMIDKTYNLKVKSILKKGEIIDILIEVLKNKRYKITNLVLGLAMENQESNKIIGSMTSSLRKKLTLPIIIVPGNLE
tara:strand:+ start:2023 stop:2490 length:468 start_codon:yes stop_codon:yes gene_type:complete